MEEVMADAAFKCLTDEEQQYILATRVEAANTEEPPRINFEHPEVFVRLLSKDLLEEWKSGEDTDLIFIAEGREIKAHKFILKGSISHKIHFIIVIDQFINAFLFLCS